MEIGAPSPPMPLPSLPSSTAADRAAPGAGVDGRVGPTGDPTDRLALAVLDGILSGSGGGREWVSLRLLPPATGAAGADTALLAAVVRAATGSLVLSTALGTIVPHRSLTAAVGNLLRLAVLSRQPLEPLPPIGPDIPTTEGAAPARSAPNIGEDAASAVIASDPDRHWSEAAVPGGRLALTLLLAAAPATMKASLAENSGSVDAAAASSTSPTPYEGARNAGGPANLDATQMWRALALPLPGTEATIDARVSYRRRDTDDQAAEPEPARFAIAFVLGRLGPVRLEGLYRRRRLDVLLRSGLPLMPDLRERLSDRFERGLAMAGLGGGIAFANLLPPAGGLIRPAIAIEV